MRAQTAWVYFICCAVWGSTWAVIKFGLVDLPPFLFCGTRMVTASLLLTPFAWRGARARLSARTWATIAAIGFLQIGVSYAMIFKAEESLSSGVTAVLFATFPIWTALLSLPLLRDEPLTLSRLAATGLAVGGVLLIEAPALRDLTGSSALLLPLGSAAFSALGNVWLKRSVSKVPPVQSLWAQTLVAGAMMLTLSLLWERGRTPHWTPTALAALGYLVCFGTLLTFLALFWLIPRVSMVAIGIIPVVDTLIAVLVGIGVLHEPFSWRVAVGGALILGGAALSVLGGR